ncbi:DUF4785 domain-containing protein [Microbulbifer yueqingensis]|uniref:DUF4785 domain-containing protein n=1 Tax=Microbulbifer yueqingensis TaxID=658219 RepID=A0A1G8V9G3_9GAMM|nr:DUF4785 domain-containing protein [Microbulbifer yueqingensis]SDJ62708.1 protein of unknown function [Microbulbifer yueqingensis]
MKTILITSTLVFCALTAAASAQEILNNSRAPVSFSQAVESDVKQQLADTGAREESRVFYRRVSGAELNRGAEFFVDGKQAVIQISPLDRSQNGKRVVDTEIPRGMTLSNGTERRPVDDDSIALHRKSEGLRQEFPGLYGRAHVMKVPEDMGRGNFTLKANGNARANAEYILYVLDKHSDIALEVQAPSKRFSRSGTLELAAGPSGSASASLESVSTTLIAPRGERYEVNGNISGNRYTASWPVNVSAASVPGELWRVEVRSTLRNSRGESLERVAVVAADIFTETASASVAGSDVRGLTLAVDVQEAGRYEARALVFGRDGNGDYQPALLSYRAEWLDAGQREMSLTVDAAKLAASGLRGPYQVHSVQFLDQGRMSVLGYLQGSWELK